MAKEIIERASLRFWVCFKRFFFARFSVAFFWRRRRERKQNKGLIFLFGQPVPQIVGLKGRLRYRACSNNTTFLTPRCLTRAAPREETRPQGVAPKKKNVVSKDMSIHESS